MIQRFSARPTPAAPERKSDGEPAPGVVFHRFFGVLRRWRQRQELAEGEGHRPAPERKAARRQRWFGRRA
jgi:hypothetical protein